jgi:hypothetical protein
MSSIPGTPYNPIRGKYGHQAVIKTCEYLDSQKIPYKTTKHFFGYWNPTLDRIYGDIIMFDKYWFDVKRNSITERSIEDFKGFGYILWHHNLDKNIFISKNKITKVRDNLILESVDSGEMAFKYRSFYQFDDLLTFEELCEKYFLKSKTI